MVGTREKGIAQVDGKQRVLGVLEKQICRLVCKLSLNSGFFFGNQSRVGFCGVVKRGRNGTGGEPPAVPGVVAPSPVFVGSLV
jgi:hypothetical protein